MGYAHLNKNDRNKIKILLERKYSLKDIARALRRSVSTISYKISENSVRGEYDPKKAQHKSYVKRYRSGYRWKKISMSKELRIFVEKHLLFGQSPAAISDRIKYHEKHLLQMSGNTIYRYLRGPYSKAIRLKLDNKKHPRAEAKKKKLSDRVFIDKRPQIIEKRERVGDVEGDFIILCKSGRGILLVVVCQKLRIAFLKIIYDVSIDEVHQAFLKIKARFSEVKSLTLNNDILFRIHKTLSKLLGLKIYFCHPYHSWGKVAWRMLINLSKNIFLKVVISRDTLKQKLNY